MFKKHPKGLIGAALANMGERFGFYTMMAILLLFLQTKFNLSNENASWIVSIFMTSIYLLSLVGGIIADKTKKIKATIFTGLIMMTAGYALLSVATPTPVPQDKYTMSLVLSCFALFVIALGNGLFKGNLQALVGQMYDDPKYSNKRDEGFSIFYMFINIGAIFAPVTAVAIRNWWVELHGYAYHQKLPDAANLFVSSNGSEGATELGKYAKEIGYNGNVDMSFATDYLDVFTTGFHYAFAAAILAMLVSVGVYLYNQKNFRNPDSKLADATGVDSSAKAPQMSAAEVKQRIYALFAVFAVVIFFWFSFHQNSITLTSFAKDYVDVSDVNLDLGFTTLKGVELFQSINPFFVVFLTPVVLAIFGWLKAKGKEPSTPKKIAIGMGIAAVGFLVVFVASIGLPAYSNIEAVGYTPNVSPLVLVLCYFVLTVAELFISPLGISFVSKVAPPQYQSLMQALWLCATAVGNLLVGVGATMYADVSLELTWSVFIVVCCLSMVTMFIMLKWLERVAK